MSSRNSRRPGNGIHYGSINPPIHIGATAPDDPRHGDLWFDISGDPGVWKWYDATAVAWKTGT